MGNGKSKLTSSHDNGAKNKQIPVISKDATKHQHIDKTMVQNVLLIWLDKVINDENNDDCQNTMTKLRAVVNTVNTFTDSEQCIDFITRIEHEKACMIISGSLGQHVVPVVHNMSQVDTIFIFCRHEEQHKQWTKDWSKIKGVFTDISSICEALKKVAQDCERNTLAISFMSTGNATSKKNLDQLDCSFMYTQILKEILLTIKFEQTHINEYIDYCRHAFAKNKNELNKIHELELNYRGKSPIWWYTYECFLYPMLNRALRTMDMNIIIKMGFFIVDLHRHIEELHLEQFGEHHHSQQVLTVYRGQGLSKTDFDKILQTKSGLMAFNNFLSTSQNHDVSLDFARRALSNPGLVGILFVMTIDPSKSSIPFASVNKVSYYEHTEDEILFSMHSVFRIQEIKSMDQTNRLWQVDLTLTNDNDPDLRLLAERMREETESNETGWYRLGLLLFKLGEPAKAQQVYEVMLEQASSELEKGPIYSLLGRAKAEQGAPEEAIKWLEKSLEIDKKSYPSHDLSLVASYNNVGLGYSYMGEYSKALSYLEKALEIQLKSLPPRHPILAKAYHNIGKEYSHMGEHSKALSYLEKALEIRQNSLPSYHPGLANSYEDIGMEYFKIRDYFKALSYLEKALEIEEKILPPHHPDLASSYGNLGLVYKNMKEYSKSLSYLEKALEIEEKILPPHHPDMAKSYGNIGLLYMNMDEWSKALSYLKKTLEIQEKSLPRYHPDLAASCNTIGWIYENKGKRSKARSFHERAVDIGERSLPPDHPDLYLYRNGLELVNFKF